MKRSAHSSSSTVGKQEERVKINYLSFYIRKLQKEGQIKFQGGRKKITLRAEINDIENRKSREKID